MLVAFISDIHANIFGLEAVISDIKKVGASHIICAGDVVGYYPFVNETIELLIQENVQCILGNHDAIAIGKLAADEIKKEQYYINSTLSVIKPENMAWLNLLPTTLDLRFGRSSVKVWHGSPWSPFEEYVYPDYQNFDTFKHLNSDYIILGHTHWPMIQHLGSVTVINPGSCGQPRDYNPGASYALWALEEDRIQFHNIQYDIMKLASILRSLNYNQQLIDILFRTR